MAIGASVAINGTCLTVTQQQGSTLRFDVMAETLRRTNLGALQEGGTGARARGTARVQAGWLAVRVVQRALLALWALARHPDAAAAHPRSAPHTPAVNFERSARVGDEIGGHTVSGHVHTTARIVKITDTENNRRVEFEVRPSLVRAGRGRRCQQIFCGPRGCWLNCPRSAAALAGLPPCHPRPHPRLHLALPCPAHPNPSPPAGRPRLDQVHPAKGLCVGGRLQPDGGRGHPRRLLCLSHPRDATVRCLLGAGGGCGGAGARCRQAACLEEAPPHDATHALPAAARRPAAG